MEFRSQGQSTPQAQTGVKVEGHGFPTPPPTTSTHTELREQGSRSDRFLSSRMALTHPLTSRSWAFLCSSYHVRPFAPALVEREAGLGTQSLNLRGGGLLRTYGSRVQSQLACGATLERFSGEKGWSDTWAWTRPGGHRTRGPPSSPSPASYSGPTPCPRLRAHSLHNAAGWRVGELKADRPGNGKKRGDARNAPGVMRGEECRGHREKRDQEGDQAVVAPRGSRGSWVP